MSVALRCARSPFRHGPAPHIYSYRPVLKLLHAPPVSVLLVPARYREQSKKNAESLAKAAQMEEFKQRQKDRETSQKKDAEREKIMSESELTYYGCHGATFTPDTSPGMRRSSSVGSSRSPSVGSNRSPSVGSSRRSRKSESKEGKEGEGEGGNSAPAMPRPPSSGVAESPN